MQLVFIDSNWEYRKVASRKTCYYSKNQVFGGATNRDMSLNCIGLLTYIFESIVLIIKVVNSGSHIFFQIFWCFTHSILSYREFVCSSPGATPFHYAAIDSLSQYTQTKFFYYYKSLWKVWKSWGHNLLPMAEIGLTDLSKSGGGAMPPPAPRLRQSCCTALHQQDRQTDAIGHDMTIRPRPA